MVRLEPHAGMTLPFLGLEHGNVHCDLPGRSTGSRLGLPYTVVNRCMQPTIDRRNQSKAARSQMGQCFCNIFAPKQQSGYTMCPPDRNLFRRTIERPSAPE